MPLGARGWFGGRVTVAVVRALHRALLCPPPTLHCRLLALCCCRPAHAPALLNACCPSLAQSSCVITAEQQQSVRAHHVRRALSIPRRFRLSRARSRAAALSYGRSASPAPHPMAWHRLSTGQQTAPAQHELRRARIPASSDCCCGHGGSSTSSCSLCLARLCFGLSAAAADTDRDTAADTIAAAADADTTDTAQVQHVESRRSRVPFLLLQHECCCRSCSCCRILAHCRVGTCCCASTDGTARRGCSLLIIIGGSGRCYCR